MKKTISIGVQLCEWIAIVQVSNCNTIPLLRHPYFCNSKQNTYFFHTSLHPYKTKFEKIRQNIKTTLNDKSFLSSAESAVRSFIFQKMCTSFYQYYRNLYNKIGSSGQTCNLIFYKLNSNLFDFFYLHSCHLLNMLMFVRKIFRSNTILLRIKISPYCCDNGVICIVF